MFSILRTATSANHNIYLNSNIILMNQITTQLISSVKLQKTVPNQEARKHMIETWALHETIDEESVALLVGLSFENMLPNVQEEFRLRISQVKNAPEGFLRDRTIKKLQDYLAQQFPPTKWDYFWTLYSSTLLLGFTTQSIAIVSSAFNTFGIFVAMAGVALTTKKPLVALKVLGTTLVKSFSIATWHVCDVLLRGEDGGNNVVGVLDSETIIDRRGKLFYKRTIEDVSREATHPVAKVVYWIARLADRIATSADTFLFQANQNMTLGSLVLRHKQITNIVSDQELYEVVITSMYAPNFNEIYRQAVQEVQDKTDKKEPFFGIKQDIDAKRRTYEITIQQTTKSNERQEAKEVGLFNTLKNTPIGLLGLVATKFELFLHKRAFTKTIGRLIVGTDFIRTTTNALNLTLDYSVYGFWRAFRPAIRDMLSKPTLFSSLSIKNQMEKYEIKSSTQGEPNSYTRKLQVAKAIIGTVYHYALADFVNNLF